MQLLQAADLFQFIRFLRIRTRVDLDSAGLPRELEARKFPDLAIYLSPVWGVGLLA